MFAKTEQTTKEKRLARLASLCATAISLIGGDKRSQRMVNVLLEALQLFKEEKLGSVVEEDEFLRRTKRLNQQVYDRYLAPWIDY